jgi:hypothetical protein
MTNSYPGQIQTDKDDLAYSKRKGKWFGTTAEKQHKNGAPTQKVSSTRFRSSDLWVMSPTRFLCATELYTLCCLSRFIISWFIGKLLRGVIEGNATVEAKTQSDVIRGQDGGSMLSTVALQLSTMNAEESISKPSVVFPLILSRHLKYR